MASTVTRRPLPALIALVALLLLTALVWWRVMNRDGGSSADAKNCPTPSAASTSSTPTGTAAPRTLPPQRTVDVLVLNATTRNGIAGKARTALLADGFRSTLRANDDDSKNKVTGTAQIRYSAANKPGAQLLQYYFPGAQLLQVSTPSEQVTVSLGPRYSAVQSQKAVTARLAADKVTLTTAAPTPTAGTSTTSRC
ncbi:LytR C-terminal domain-containing protein [uncultured Jatrophihabitans sp.]|uniref:LytR C-terminal domain-containing protein n=1 Tax=uncultured Jatrophihabitans sp. TaxID=1610747 RepID=UPI0035CA17D5